jgi:signal transduction histidine kinase
VWREAGLDEVESSIAASWHAGERRIGALVAFDSIRGFSLDDLWVLRMAALAAGLVWQYKEAEDELGQTAVRLEEAVAARRHLLNNIASGGDEARRRFASTLHDDSLQLLTGAELQLERIRAEAVGSRQPGQLDQLGATLRKVEDSLRRLLINVSPEVLTLPRDIKEAISERLESMRINSGIEPHSDLDLPADMPEAIEAIILKNLSEALTNVEKHAKATRVVVVAHESDGGFVVEVTDNGKGFVVSQAAHMPGHLGLLAMRERAQLAGGWFRVVSEPGAGASLKLWVPKSL